LSKTFRRVTGHTPAAWRRARGGDGDAGQHGATAGMPAQEEAERTLSWR
jgi:hypothetical protein